MQHLLNTPIMLRELLSKRNRRRQTPNRRLPAATNRPDSTRGGALQNQKPKPKLMARMTSRRPPDGARRELSRENTSGSPEPELASYRARAERVGIRRPDNREGNGPLNVEASPEHGALTWARTRPTWHPRSGGCTISMREPVVTSFPSIFCGKTGATKLCSRNSEASQKYNPSERFDQSTPRDLLDPLWRAQCSQRCGTTLSAAKSAPLLTWANQKIPKPSKLQKYTKNNQKLRKIPRKYQ